MNRVNLNYYCISHIGKRLNHEDNFLLSNGRHILPSEQEDMPQKGLICCAGTSSAKFQIFAVSDGMGGHNAGETASMLCVSKLSKISKRIQDCCDIKDAVMLCQKEIESINNGVYRLSRTNIDKKDMGATLVLQIFCKDQCAVLNLGDSRAYFFDDISLNKLTKDNTEGQRMLDLNLLNEDEVKSFPARKNINRYIGFHREKFVLKADEYVFDRSEGVYLLCSDGLTDALTENKICKVLKESKNIESASKTLIECAASKQNSDNITIILISTKE